MMDIKIKFALGILCSLIYLDFKSSLCSCKLLQVPINVRVDSEVVYTDPDRFDVYTVDEFVDANDGSCHLRIINDNQLDEPVELISYYRIKQAGKDFRGGKWNHEVVAYNHKDDLCTEQDIRHDWKLKGLTNTLSQLFSSIVLNTDAIELDRTAVGPLALLKIVYANAHLFKVAMRAFEVRLADAYYFQATIALNNEHSARIICVIPVMHIDNKDQILMDQTLLSEVSATNHASSIAIVYTRKNDETDRNKKNPVELLDMKYEAAKRLIVTYYLIQERSTSKHMGLKVGSLAGEENPFALPLGAGCGTVSGHNPFHVGAKQFSGLFHAKDLPNQRFVAYDAETRHIRIDSVGEHRMIYDLNERIVTYIGDRDHLYENGAAHGNHKEGFDDRAHCAQSYLLAGDDADRISEVSSLEDVLGFDRYTNLMFLGTTLLEDGTHCMMFEREITRRQIPLLAKLNLRANTREINDRARLFMVYYFVDELRASNLEFAFSYRSMWLKRFEVYSRSELLVHTIINSQVTFSEFTWTLESMDSSLELKRALNLDLVNPVRVFDTMECVSKHDLQQLELLIKETPDSEGKSTMSKKKNTNIGGSREIWRRAGSFEEAIMVTLSKRKRISRSQINQFELVEPRLKSIKTNDDEDTRLLLVKAKLSFPMNYKFERALVGWIKSYSLVPFNEYGELIKSGSGITFHECSLMLASKFKNKDKVHMVYGINVGCGYLNELNSFEYIKKNSAGERAPSLADYSDMCEIYTQSKVVNGQAMTAQAVFSERLIEKEFRELEINVEFDSLEEVVDSKQVESKIFTGQVIKVSISKALGPNSLGTVSDHGICYTSESKLFGPTNKGVDSRMGLSTVVLNFDMHQSLVHCHKACQLYPHCSSYSYNKLRRECILTNLPENSWPVNLEVDKNCYMFTPNNVHLYKGNSIVISSTVAELVEHQHYVARTNLNDCASLCRLYQFNEDIVCQSFKFFRLLSICLVEDKKGVIKRALPTGVDQESQSAEWNTINKYYLYKRNYIQYYAIKQFSKRELKSEVDQTFVSPADDGYQPIDLEAATILYDLDYDDCLRECTVINPNCFMVDHCSEMRRAESCTMYLLKGTMFEGNRQFVADADIIYNLNARVDERYDLARDYTCTHHFLKDDNLLLKVQLLLKRQSTREDQAEDIEIKLLAEQDRSKSDAYLSLSKGIVQDYAGKKKPTLGITSSFLFLVIGMFVGSMTFLYQSRLIARARQLRYTKTHFVSVSWLKIGSNRDRSPSQIEFNELDDFLTGPISEVSKYRPRAPLIEI